ncbi:MAG: zinc-binding dehydrogenase [Pseudonocardiaceae bacterium]
MRAVVVDEPGGPEVLQVVDVPAPSPDEGELSIDVDFAGVGFVDTLFRAGAFGLAWPFIPGIEVTGRVRELGAGVEGFRVGQPIAALLNDFGRGSRAGGYAEVAVARTGMVTTVPEGADLARAAAVLVNGVTGWIALHHLARLQTSDDVVVLGASGGLGGTASRLAAIHPARRVIGVAGSDTKRRFIPAECTDVICGSQLSTALTKITDGRGVDVVIDPVGGQLRAEAYERLAPFGRLIVLVNASGQDQALSSDAAWHGTRHLAGLSLGGIAHLVPAQISAAASTVVGLVHRGVLHEPAPTLLPLNRVSETHRALQDRCAPPKTVLAIHDNT